jgi:UDP-glucuronate 4-epimerase
MKTSISMPVLSASSDDDTCSLTGSINDNSTIESSPKSSMRETLTCVDLLCDETHTLPTECTPHTGYKKVLVTGGAGFIGSHVAQFLLARGDDVVIVDEVNDYYDVAIKESNLQLLRTEYPDEKRLQIYRGDICDEKLMTSIFENERPEWVCHMAARAGVRPSIQDPYVYIHSNIKGTTHLLELSAKYGVKNFVFASSSSVYGGSKSTFFSEEEVVDNPVSPYAASKKACELLAYTYHHLYNLNISALRFFTVYGPRGRPDMAPFIFIDRVSRGLEIKQFGDGTSSRDYTYIDDIVDGIVRAVDRPHKYEVFNLGKGSGTSLGEFIYLVQKYTEKDAIVKVLPDQPGDVPYTCADVSKAYRMLGYRSKVSFEEGICRTVKWYNGAYAAKVESIGKVAPVVEKLASVSTSYESKSTVCV